jgi:predicted TIM-barrel fold metal-dependent hydrolase
MKGIGAEETARYLCALTEIRSSCQLYDTHVHPYEVLFDRFSYEESEAPGLLTMSGKSYLPASAGAVRFSEAADFNSDPRSERLRDISVMLLGRIYASVGEKVFRDQMEQCGIDTVLLLPVAAESSDTAEFESRMQWVHDFYPDRNRFWLAGSVPATLGAEEIEPYAAGLKRKFGIRAMKCHPVVSGIDLGSVGRRQWLEMLLRACHRLELPLIIHGGRNNPYWGGSRGNFGSIAHLREIDFSLSRQPVVLAHAAMHRCPLQEMAQEGLPMLKRMLDRHPNLFVDISGLGFEQLKLVLGAVEPERILFGSDALYAPQWEVAVMTLHALKELGMRGEESFVTFAGSNPRKTIFRGDAYARQDQDTVQPVLGRGQAEIAP